MNDNHSLSHSKWNCKYHIVFAPKYRRQVIYGQIKADIGGKPVGRGRWRREEVETGDEGLSATGTSSH